MTAARGRGGRLRLGRHPDPWHTIDFARPVAGLRRRPYAPTTPPEAERSRTDHGGRGARPGCGCAATAAAPGSRRSCRGRRRRRRPGARGALAAYEEFWEPHTLTDPDVPALFAGLRERGHTDRRPVEHDLVPRVPRAASSPGTASSTFWTAPSTPARSTTPSRTRRRSGRRCARSASSDPARACTSATGPTRTCTAPSASGMRAVLVPHSDIPPTSRCRSTSRRTPSSTGWPRCSRSSTAGTREPGSTCPADVSRSRRRRCRLWRPARVPPTSALKATSSGMPLDMSGTSQSALAAVGRTNSTPPKRGRSPSQGPCSSLREIVILQGRCARSANR